MKEQIPSSLPQSPPSLSLYPSLASSLLPSKDIPDTQMAWLFFWFLQETSSFPPQALTSYLLRAENWSPAISMDVSVSLKSSLPQTFPLCCLLLLSLMSDLLACYPASFLWFLKIKIQIHHYLLPFPLSNPVHRSPWIIFWIHYPFVFSCLICKYINTRASSIYNFPWMYMTWGLSTEFRWSIFQLFPKKDYFSHFQHSLVASNCSFSPMRLSPSVLVCLLMSSLFMCSGLIKRQL